MCESITLHLPGAGLTPGTSFERQIVVRAVGELEAALGGRAYLWGWCTAMSERTRLGLPLSELDAFSTAERYGFGVAEASASRQVWRHKALDAGRVGQ
jgi:hypothetical protein